MPKARCGIPTATCSSQTRPAIGCTSGIRPPTTVSIFREPSAGATALGFDREGRLLATEHRNRRISRTESDGSIVTVVDRYEGKRLNSPNDFVVARDGTIFFTDPPYGLPRQVEGKELDFQGVYRLDPDGRLRLLVRTWCGRMASACRPTGERST